MSCVGSRDYIFPITISLVLNAVKDVWGDERRRGKRNCNQETTVCSADGGFKGNNKLSAESWSTKMQDLAGYPRSLSPGLTNSLGCSGSSLMKWHAKLCISDSYKFNYSVSYFSKKNRKRGKTCWRSIRYNLPRKNLKIKNFSPVWLLSKRREAWRRQGVLAYTNEIRGL